MKLVVIDLRKKSRRARSSKIKYYIKQRLIILVPNKTKIRPLEIRKNLPER